MPRTQTQRPARKPRYFTEAQILEAINATGGILSDAARWLQAKYKRSCSRSTISRAVNGNPNLQAACALVDERFGDHAEGLLWSHIERGSERSLHFYMAHKMKDRGYGNAVEVTGKGGGPVQHNYSFEAELARMSWKELVALAGLLDAAAAGETAPASGAAPD